MAHLYDISHGIVLVVLGVIAQGFIRIGKVGNRELFFFRRGRRACFGWGCIGGVAFPTACRYQSIERIVSIAIDGIDLLVVEEHGFVGIIPDLGDVSY